ncbi:MAG: hydantoinase/oxoprolinase family protein [Pseudomonadota bacterium]
MTSSPETARRVLLGVDTGGTCTDAVVIDEARMGEGSAAVLAKAKALTTRDDLARGIGAAVDRAMGWSTGMAGIPATEVAMVALSTTLATNALVEGQGGRAALVMIGFDERDVARQGLGEALGGDPVIRIPGGHDAMGAEQAPVDLDALRAALNGLQVGSFAICGHFAVRNPAHEIAAREVIREATGCPVTCSHELSAKIGGPKRALTALLNARLIAMIDRLIASAEGLIAARGIMAPLMVVRGDGALVSAGFARDRPIETILSGPAASLVGAGWLSGLSDAVVSDIGGTTTDIAVLSGCRPRIDPAGAEVGGMRTMVEAVAMRTHGLGGDSEVGIGAGLSGDLTLGPRRVIPVCLLAQDHAQMVHAALDTQLNTSRTDDLDARFLIRLRAPVPGLSTSEESLIERLAAGPLPAQNLFRNRMDRMAAKRLTARGLVGQAGFTPSDAAHILGLQQGWDRDAAQKAAQLFARRKRDDGKPLADNAESVATRVIERLTRRSAELVLEAALTEDGFAGTGLAATPLAQAALDGRTGLVRPRLTLELPLIGLGASAPTYYPGVADLVGAPNAVPEHADVANAIGAVVGHVRLSRSATISVPQDGIFRAHLPTGPKDFNDQALAEAALTRALDQELRRDANAAGADEPQISTEIDRREAEIEGRITLVEAVVTVIAMGRPRLARGEPDAELPAGFSGL